MHWTCPYCNRDTEITYVTEAENNLAKGSKSDLIESNGSNSLSVKTTWIVCPNKQCKKPVLTATLTEIENLPNMPNFWKNKSVLKNWNLLPSSNSRIFPEYIPLALRQDYLEACLIVELSPKASATLSRRCLQGIIRDFYSITDKKTLHAEINAIKDLIDPILWDAIDAVRKIGNIGAHMEHDINLIIDVDPTEAEHLITLIEILFNDLYISRHNKLEAYNKIIAASQAKAAQKQTP
ncbi:DUF4145 domain-containing protein [Emticicia soli]|uniref:DUF4145 domain-containing protein n=1 Tax=Emticicia soli TaxID=2027878 RepID=A0ABW5J6G0_9BACT